MHCSWQEVLGAVAHPTHLANATFINRIYTCYGRIRNFTYTLLTVIFGFFLWLGRGAFASLRWTTACLAFGCGRFAPRSITVVFVRCGRRFFLFAWRLTSAWAAAAGSWTTSGRKFTFFAGIWIRSTRGIVLDFFSNRTTKWMLHYYYYCAKLSVLRNVHQSRCLNRHACAWRSCCEPSLLLPPSWSTPHRPMIQL